MKLTILSNEERKAEAIRAIVTAQLEFAHYWGQDIEDDSSALIRQDDACEWLSLVA